MHMAQLIPLPLTVSCFSKIQIGFTFPVLAYPGSLGQTAIEQVCVCVCVLVYRCFEHRHLHLTYNNKQQAQLSQMNQATPCTTANLSHAKVRAQCDKHDIVKLGRHNLQQ